MHPSGLTGATDSSVVVELHVVPPVAAAVLDGDLDLHTQSQLDAIVGLVRDTSVVHLTLDVRAVDFMGLGALTSIADACAVLATRGGALTVYGARPLHRRVLDLLDAPSVEISE
ncbi:MAG TPA: STAS domain-containing protein [Acidimicrobiales bacterium]